jgi:hypothetical protein
VVLVIGVVLINRPQEPRRRIDALRKLANAASDADRVEPMLRGEQDRLIDRLADTADMDAQASRTPKPSRRTRRRRRQLCGPRPRVSSVRPSRRTRISNAW